MARKLTKKNTKVQKVVKKNKVETGKASKHSVALIATPTGEYTEAVGRRKTATARVRLYHTPGDFIVNGKAAGQYFGTVPYAHSVYNQPFNIAEKRNQFTVSISVNGSGPKAQLGAAIHGIARALVKFDPTLRVALKAEGFLTRDDRMKETRKIGTGGKARRKRQSPKR